MILNNGNSQVSFNNEYLINVKSNGASTVLDDDGTGIIAANYSSDNGDYQSVIFKIDNQGDTIWVKSLEAGSNVARTQIIKVSNGGFLYVVNDQNEPGVYAIRLNEAGEEVWSRKFENNFSNFIQQPSVAEIIGVGFAIAVRGSGGRLICHKINYDGDLDWTKLFKGTGAANGNSVSPQSSIIASSDNHLILVSASFSDSIENNNAFIVKINLSGNVIWSKSLGGDSPDLFRKVVETNSGDFIAIGYTESYGEGEADILIIKFDKETGNIIYSKTYGLDDQQHVFSIKRGSNDDFYIAGMTGALGGSERKGLLLKIDADGNILWSKSYNNNCIFLDLDINESNDILITGFYSTGPSIFDTISTLAIKASDFNSCGFEEIEFISADQPIEFTDLIFSDSGGMASNESITSRTLDFSINIFCDPILNLNELPEQARLNIFPNPTANEYLIDLQNHPDGIYEFNLYNQLGILIRSEKVYGGNIVKSYKNSISFGIYFYTLTFNNEIVNSGNITFIN